MDNPVITLSLTQLALAFVPVAITLIILFRWSYGTGNALYALGRMVVQLLAIGYVLAWIFQADNGLLILLVLAIMLSAAAWIAMACHGLLIHPDAQIGNIQLANFVNASGLEAIGSNLFIETAASGAAQQSTPGENGVGQVIQGALETSNVNVVEELVNMVATQRAYEMNSRVVSTADQMLQFVTQNL